MAMSVLYVDNIRIILDEVFWSVERRKSEFPTEKGGGTGSSMPITLSHLLISTDIILWFATQVNCWLLEPTMFTPFASYQIAQVLVIETLDLQRAIHELQRTPSTITQIRFVTNDNCLRSHFFSMSLSCGHDLSISNSHT